MDITHRDLNPKNILITPDFKEIKIIDFGLAKELTPQSKKDEMETCLTPLGDMMYRSPQMKVGNYDMCNDYWIIGKIFVELLLGKVIKPKKFHFSSYSERLNS